MEERAQKPEFGNIGTGKYGKITLEDVSKNFNKYNFIIEFKSFTVDTSRFFGCGYSGSNLLTGSSIVPDGAQTLLRTLTKGLLLYNIDESVGQETTQDHMTEVIVLPEIEKSGAIINYNVIVKSKRDFLLNQKQSKFPRPQLLP